jgi:hypothetical protein
LLPPMLLTHCGMPAAFSFTRHMSMPPAVFVLLIAKGGIAYAFGS